MRKSTTNLPSVLVQYATFVFSIHSSSANCEGEFSRQSWLMAPRRSSLTSTNRDKRLTCSKLIPQKRRLEMAIRQRKKQP